MAQTGVLLRIGCGDGQVVVTDQRVFMRGLTQSSEELWSVPRARVAGVQAHAGLILTDLTVRTCDGETYNAAKVGASDVLLAINLLGYVPEHNGNGNAAASATDMRVFDLVCGDARLSVSDTEVEWTGERPWRLLRKEIVGVSARMQSPYTELAVHTHSGRICRASRVPVYGAVRVVELLGYMDAQSHRRGDAAHGATSNPPRVRRATTPIRQGKIRDTRATRRAMRTTPLRAAASMRTDSSRPRAVKRASWLSVLLSRLHLKRA